MTETLVIPALNEPLVIEGYTYRTTEKRLPEQAIGFTTPLPYFKGSVYTVCKTLERQAKSECNSIVIDRGIAYIHIISAVVKP